MNATHDTFRPFTIDVDAQRDVVRVAPQGEIDLATVGLLRDRVGDLLATGPSRLVLDLHDVTFMDSTGLRLVLELLHASRDDDWELSLVGVAPAVHRVFELSGVLEALPLAEPEAA